MSYILDALRKSEQQRQSIQPDTVTDRLLINTQAPQHKQKSWLMALLVINLMAIAAIAWHFIQNPAKMPGTENNVVAQNAVVPAPPVNQDKPPQNAGQLAQQQQAKAYQPSISQLVEANKAPPALSPKPSQSKEIQAKKPPILKKEPPATVAVHPEKPITKKGLADLNDLPYETRNALPNLTINVFSYAHEPEDRFVIIDMVKYRTGQRIKGSATLKEIRPDGIIVQYGNETFKVDRP